MSVNDLPLIDRVAQEVKDEGGWSPEPFRLTADIEVPPVSLAQLEEVVSIMKMGKNIKDEDVIIPLFRILLGASYDEAMAAIPFAYSEKVLRALVKHQLPSEIVEGIFGDLSDDE